MVNNWLRREFGYDVSKRQQTSSASCARFTAINTDLSFCPGMEAADEDTEEEEI